MLFIHTHYYMIYARFVKGLSVENNQLESSTVRYGTVVYTIILTKNWSIYHNFPSMKLPPKVGETYWQRGNIESAVVNCMFIGIRSVTPINFPLYQVTSKDLYTDPSTKYSLQRKVNVHSKQVPHPQTPASYPR